MKVARTGSLDSAGVDPHLLLDLAVPIPTALVAIAYVASLTDPTAIETIVMAIGLIGPGVVGAGLAAHNRSHRGGAASALDTQRVVFLASLSSVVIAPMLLSVCCSLSWLGGTMLRSLALASGAHAAMASLVAFYAVRRGLAESAFDFGSTAKARDENSSALENEASGLGRSAKRMQVALVVPALVGMLVVVDFTLQSLSREADRTRAEWALAVAEILANPAAEDRLEQGIDWALPPATLRPGDTTAAILSIDSVGGSDVSRFGPHLLASLDRGLGVEGSSGVLRPREGDRVGAFRVMPGGDVIVIAVERAAMDSWAPTLLVAVCALLIFVFSCLVVADLQGSLSRLRRRIRGIAAGDLQADTILPSDDEFAAMEEDLDLATRRFRATLEGARTTVDGVEATIGRLGEALTRIDQANTSQSHQIQAAHQLMSHIDERANGAAASAVTLDHTIDESSNSVLELGAAGDELNETASVLTSKVDAVSDSLEQMVRSVKEVGSTTDRLAEASEETSSSMEEMASAMRAVDTAAETTANLSSDVVEKAELGQAKVAQTIEGMEAIRQATDAAERVIRGLGARTNEIGGILDVIDDVADETNLLALNAAIIAAQAGEHGKAFSVVADEIKELADRVLASTKEIGGLIRAVQEESENAIGAIEAGSASVMSGVDLSAEAGKTLEEITEASRESGTRIGEIVSSVREQTKAASHVVALMERVRESADQIGAASSQQDRGNEIVYRSALTMREVAQQVRRTTEDQAAGFGRIRRNVAGVRGSVESITAALREQTEACSQVTVHLDGVSEHRQTTEAAERIVRAAMEDLGTQASSLREHVERFRG